MFKLEEKNKLDVQDGDYRDEQAGSIGHILDRIATAAEQLADAAGEQ